MMVYRTDCQVKANLVVNIILASKRCTQLLNDHLGRYYDEIAENVCSIVSFIKKLKPKYSNDEDDYSFTLEDKCSEPFFVDDGLFTSLEAIDFTGMKPPAELAKFRSFVFLYN